MASVRDIKHSLSTLFACFRDIKINIRFNSIRKSCLSCATAVSLFFSNWNESFEFAYLANTQISLPFVLRYVGFSHDDVGGFINVDTTDPNHPTSRCVHTGTSFPRSGSE